MPFTMTMPKLSPTMEEGTITRWHKKEGDFVEAGELLLEIATDKATVEHNALDEGWLRQIIVKEGGSAKINDLIAIFSESKDDNIDNLIPKKVEAKTETKTEEAPSPAKEVKAISQPEVAMKQPQFVPSAPLENYHFNLPTSYEKRIKATPLARRLAKERQLDLSTVKGSGPGGRITSKDLGKAQPLSQLSSYDKVPEIAPGTYESIPLSPMRKVIARRLQESKTFIPHFYVKQTIDAQSLIQIREQLKNLGIKVTYNDLMIRGCALALRKHPEVNRGFNSAEQTLIQYKTIDISVAVTLPEGLITPIIRHVDYKPVGAISTEVRELAEKAKKGKLLEHEYVGGSFCISNLGMFGITEFSAVINPPQGAILAVGGIEEAPVVKDGKIVAGHTLSLTLSVDHRVIDGALAAQFLKTLQFFLENPASLIL